MPLVILVYHTQKLHLFASRDGRSWTRVGCRVVVGRFTVGVYSPIHLELYLDVREHSRPLHAEPPGALGLRLPAVAHTQQNHRRQGA